MKISKTYSYFTLRNDSEINLFHTVAGLGIPNPVLMHEYHLTFIASETLYQNYRSEAHKVVPIEIFATDLDLWDNNLILMIDSIPLKQLYEEMMKKYKIQSKYEIFKPHITLSYNCSEYDFLKIKKMYYDMQIYRVLNSKKLFLDGEHVNLNGIPIFSYNKYFKTGLKK